MDLHFPLFLPFSHANSFTGHLILAQVFPARIKLSRRYLLGGRRGEGSRLAWLRFVGIGFLVCFQSQIASLHRRNRLEVRRDGATGRRRGAVLESGAVAWAADGFHLCNGARATDRGGCLGWCAASAGPVKRVALVAAEWLARAVHLDHKFYEDVNHV
ncbi:hypothetical protein ACSQ67_022585 [Phaseolus vulgaris]